MTNRALPICVSFLLALATTSALHAEDERPTRRGGASFTVASDISRFGIYVNVHAPTATTIPAGTILVSSNPSEQKFVIGRAVHLDAGERTRVQVYCLDHDLTAAPSGTRMRISGRAQWPVLALLGGSASSEARQRAIWVARGTLAEARNGDGTVDRGVAELLERAGIDAQTGTPPE